MNEKRAQQTFTTTERLFYQYCAPVPRSKEAIRWRGYPQRQVRAGHMQVDESRPHSPLLPPAPTFLTPSYQLNSTAPPASLAARATAILVTTKMETTFGDKQDGLPELETRVCADIRKGYES